MFAFQIMAAIGIVLLIVAIVVAFWSVFREPNDSEPPSPRRELRMPRVRGTRFWRSPVAALYHAAAEKHLGATENWSPKHEPTQRPPRADLPDTRAMRLAADRETHERLSDVEAWLSAELSGILDSVMQELGVSPGDMTGAEDFNDARTLAGVIVLPAAFVDWSATGEYAIVGT